MKKILIVMIFVITGVVFGCLGHLSVKNYFYKNYFNNEIKSDLVYNDFLSYNNNPNVVEVSSTTTSVTTTKVVTTTKSTTTKKNRVISNTTTTEQVVDKIEVMEEKKESDVVLEEVQALQNVTFDGMNLEELTDKLNKSLTSTLTNTGLYFSNYYGKTGLDPYLAIAIVLQETGCKWTCSKLVRECNNIGGIKGEPRCNGGSYKKFDSLESGINGYLDMLYNNYYSKGLTTPELINPKYAASTTWSEKINNYILEIKSK